MSLTIENYAAWANAHIGGDNASASLGRDGKLADIKTTTSGIARFFHTRSFTSARDAVRADFQHALTERFGDTLATSVMKGVGPDLTASVISHVLSAARLTAMRSALAPSGEGRVLRLTDGDLVLTQQTIGGLSDDARKALTQFLKANNLASDLLGTTPTGERECEEFGTRIDDAVKGLETAKRTLRQAFAEGTGALPPRGLARLLQTCDDEVNRLSLHRQHVQELNDGNPLSEASVGRYRDTWHEAFTQTCFDLAMSPELANNDKAIHALLDLAHRPKADFDRDFKLSGSLGKSLQKLVEKTLTDACGKNPLGKGVAKAALSRNYGRVLNARPWNTISKSFTGSLGGQTFGLTSTIKPGKHIADVGNHYPEGVNGYMCHSADTSHAVNLAISSLKMKDASGFDQEVFTGVRHAVNSAYEIKDAQVRQEANRTRATETVKAAFVAYLGRHPNSGTNVELPMTSVSLLTPDVFRNTEKKMLLEQTAAWQAVDGKAIDVVVDGKTYHVTPKIATFNFGVNAGAVGLFSDLSGGWGTSDKINVEAFKTLASRVREFVQQTFVPPAKRLAAQRLVNQVRDILMHEAERTDGHDAYKAASRIAVLTSLMDGVPCYNCKSGKDRTGEMDVECKFLATLIAQGLEIPEPGAPLTGEQKALFRTIALESGNHEMQEYNTGIAGFKTAGVSSIVERLGGDEARKVHAGGSAFVKV